MNLSEFLEDKDYSRCKYCNNTFLTAPIGVNGGEEFDAVNVVLHLMTCHQDVVAQDKAMQEETSEWLDLDMTAL